MADSSEPGTGPEPVNRRVSVGQMKKWAAIALPLLLFFYMLLCRPSISEPPSDVSAKVVTLDGRRSILVDSGTRAVGGQLSAVQLNQSRPYTLTVEVVHSPLQSLTSTRVNAGFPQIVRLSTLPQGRWRVVARTGGEERQLCVFDVEPNDR